MLDAGNAVASSPTLGHAIVVAPPVTGWTTIFGITINPMAIVLGLAVLLIGFLVWKAQRDEKNPFDIWDLFLENGKANPTRTAFLTAFVMTSWVIIDREIKGTLDITFFGAYLAGWVGPLAAKIIMNKDAIPVIPLKKEGE